MNKLSEMNYNLKVARNPLSKKIIFLGKMDVTFFYFVKGECGREEGNKLSEMNYNLKVARNPLSKKIIFLGKMDVTFFYFVKGECGREEGILYLLVGILYLLVM